MSNNKQSTEKAAEQGGQVNAFVSLRSITELKTGDIIQSKMDGKGYVVTGNYSDYAIAIRQIRISNSSDWLKLNK